MTVLFVILIVLASIILGLIVLVQNPKGGGLAGNIAGFSNQFMGVKQTTDVLEKGTWIFGAIIGILCIISTLFISENAGVNRGSKLQTTPTTTPATNNNATNPGTLPGAQPQTAPKPDSGR